MARSDERNGQRMGTTGESVITEQQVRSVMVGAPLGDRRAESARKEQRTKGAKVYDLQLKSSHAFAFVVNNDRGQ